MKPSPINILLVEDNIADIRFTEEAFKFTNLKVKLTAVLDGETALNYIHQRAEYKSVPRPDLIMLDLNLPKIKGHEVLASIKNDKDLKKIPVIVLTSSKSEQDITDSYKLLANCFIRKPIDMNGFIEVVKNVEKFWFNVVSLPS